MKDLDIIEEQMSVGQVKTIRSNGGKTVDYVELLFSPTTNAQFWVDKKNDRLMMSVKDVDLTLPKMECVVKKSTLRDLIISLKDLYNELSGEEDDE